MGRGRDYGMYGLRRIVLAGASVALLMTPALALDNLLFLAGIPIKPQAAAAACAEAASSDVAALKQQLQWTADARKASNDRLKAAGAAADQALSNFLSKTGDLISLQADIDRLESEGAEDTGPTADETTISGQIQEISTKNLALDVQIATQLQIMADDERAVPPPNHSSLWFDANKAVEDLRTQKAALLASSGPVLARQVALADEHEAKRHNRLITLGNLRARLPAAEKLAAEAQQMVEASRAAKRPRPLPPA